MRPHLLHLYRSCAAPVFTAVVAVVFTAALAGACDDARAQTISMTSDPAVLARAAIGAEPGTSAVGVMRNGQTAYGFVQDGVPLALKSDAPRDQPLFEIGSISKVFTGLLVAQAVERGDVALDDNLGVLLKGKVVFSSETVASITLRQLLTHSACLPRQYGQVPTIPAIVAQIREGDRAGLWDALARQAVPQQPPCVPTYSNYGMAVVGEWLSERYGKPWDVLVRERITGPLGMADTRQHLGDQAYRLVAGFNGKEAAPVWDMVAFAGAGGLRSTPHDMLLLGRAILAGKAGPLGAAAERLVTPLGPFQGGQIGYAIFLTGPPNKRSFSHDGLTGGYRALMTLHQDTGEVLVALVSNTQAPLPLMGANLAASRYPVSTQAISVDPSTLRTYTGVFRVNPELAFTCVVQGGALFVRASRNNFKAYIPVGVDTFTRPAGGAQLTFLRKDGQITGVQLDQGGRVTLAALTTEKAPARATLSSEETDGLAGRYLLRQLTRANIDLDVNVELGQLAVKSSNWPRLQVYPVEGVRDRFFYEEVKAELQFERDADGKAVALTLHQNGVFRLLRAEKPQN